MEGSRKKLISEFTVIMVVSYISFAPTGYFSVLLRNLGFDSWQLGFWNSMMGLIAMVTLPFWGVISDKLRSPRKIWIITMAIYAVSFGLLPISGTLYPAAPLLLYILIMAFGIVKDPTHSIQDAWYINTLSSYNVSFASIRMWGALSCGLASIILGLIANYTGINAFFYAVPVVVLPSILLGLKFNDSEYDSKAASKPERLRPWVLFKNYGFMTSLIMTLVLSSYMSMIAGFVPFIMEGAGVPSDQYGILYGYSVLVQAVCMLSITRVFKNIPMRTLLIVGGLCAVVENILYAVSFNFTTLFIASTFWGIEVSIFATALPSYTHSMVDEKYAATAQTIKSATSMLLMVIGNLLGGRIIAAHGIKSYNIGVAVFQAALIFLFIISIPIGRRFKLYGR